MHGLTGFITKFDLRRIQQIFLLTLAVLTVFLFISSWAQWLPMVWQKLPRDISMRWLMSFPSDDFVQRPSRVAALTNQGVFNDNQGNFKEAVFDFSKAIDLDPQHAEAAYADRGDMYDKIGYLTQAMSDLNKAIAIDPQDVDAYMNRGNVYFHQENFIQAIADYSKAIEINSQDGLVYSDRAISYYQLKEYDKALADVHRAEELGSTVNPDLVNLLKIATGQI